MTRRPILCAAAFAAAAFALPTSALAAWSSDPAVNLSVADAAGDQVQPKVAPTSDGGCYLSWFDAIGNGFDVRVQKLDAAGNELLAHNGVLVADRGFSSTQDYGLDVDAAGNALLTFRDDSVGGVQITAAKVSPSGVLLWGASGVQLTGTSDFVAAPKIAGTTDGGAVVAWTQDVNTMVQKLDAGGVPQWTTVVLTPATGSYSVSDLHGAGTGAILSFVYQTGGFGSPRLLYAQKFDGSGSFLWGASHVAVFDGGSLQFGNFPYFVPDGSGGAVFSWYDAASLALQCYAQHITSAGAEAFAHNGAAASTNGVRVRVSPWAAYNPSTGETFLFWTEENSAQSMFGVYGQKFDAAGNRQWGAEGSVIVPVGADGITMVRCLTEGTGAFAYWSQAASFGQDKLRAARLDAAGAIDVTAFDFASTPSGKSRLDVARSTAGFAVLAWSDDRSDAGDVLAQNVNPDGSLGAATDVSADPGMGAGTAAAASARGAGLGITAAWPNPTAQGVRFAWSAAAGAGDVELGVYDVRGKLVRRLGAGPASGASAPEGTRGGGTGVWDGRDEAGAPVTAGVYWLRLHEGAESAAARVIVAR
jgi:hypothetical protein